MVDSKVGKIKILRVSEQGWDVWGADPDALQAEVFVTLDSEPNMAFGLTLKGLDQDLSSHLGMLSVLRDAFINQLKVGISYDPILGKNNQWIKRVQLEK